MFYKSKYCHCSEKMLHSTLNAPLLLQFLLQIFSDLFLVSIWVISLIYLPKYFHHYAQLESFSREQWLTVFQSIPLPVMYVSLLLKFVILFRLSSTFYSTCSASKVVSLEHLLKASQNSLHTRIQIFRIILFLTREPTRERQCRIIFSVKKLPAGDWLATKTLSKIQKDLFGSSSCCRVCTVLFPKNAAVSAAWKLHSG